MKHGNPCKTCGSSDAVVEYDDGAFCFSCSKKETKAKPRIKSLPDKIEKPRDHRGIKASTFAKYGCLFSKDTLFLPYGSTYVARSLEGEKQYDFIGSNEDVDLFGSSIFSAAEAKAVTVCEGAIDALSVNEMLGGYPAVAVRSVSTAVNEIRKKYKYLDAFDKIYLCFDNDKPGKKAAQEVAKLFDPRKVYHVILTKYKDANEYLDNGELKEFQKIWWNSKRYLPEGIITAEDIEGILNRKDDDPIATFPFAKLQRMTYGIFPSKYYLIKAQEKIGKTEFFRVLEHHILKTTNHNIGMIHLEESEKRALQGIINYELRTPVHLPDCGISKADQVKAYLQVDKNKDRVHLYNHFGTDDPDVILNVIRYMASVLECKVIFLDHITMLVTGFEEDNERKKLDYLSTRLSMLTRELDFTLFLISHVNDDGKTRGSRNISKVADFTLAIDRDKEHADDVVRNTTRVTVVDNRLAGTSGPAGLLYFDPKTYCLEEKEDAAPF